MHRYQFPPRSCLVVLASLWCLGCRDDNPSAPIIPFLEVQYIGGSINADLMPVVPPDPINAQVTLTVKNTHTSQSMTGLKVLKANVYRENDDQLLGSISFASTWDGSLSPGELDSVVATKVQSGTTLFSPPCDQYVYLTIFIGTDSSNTTDITTDSLMFTCVY